MTLFKYSRFLCYSMPSFGVSAISPKKSSSNISPTSVIAFITGWNYHQMKNNIRYKGNTNKTSVIIFFNRKSKTPSDGTFLGRTSVEVFVVVHFCFSFCGCSSFHFWSSFYCCCFSFHFQAAFPCHRHSILASEAREDLHQLWALLWLLSIAFAFPSPASATILSKRFYPQAFLTLRSITKIFDSTCVYQGLPGSW